MNRRTFLLATTAGLGTASGCITSVRDRVPSDIVGSSNTTQEPPFTFGFNSPGFDQVDWTENGRLAVTFGDDHDIDGFGIRYHTKNDFDDDILLSPAPKYGGKKTVDFLGAVASAEGRPPSGMYLLVAYKGSIHEHVSLVEEEMGTVSFPVQPQLDLVSATVSENDHLSLQVENSGNAPAIITQASNTDQGVSLKAGVRVNHGESTLVTLDGNPFKEVDKGCRKVLPEFNVSIQAIPRASAATVATTPYEEAERHCTVTM